MISCAYEINYQTTRDIYINGRYHRVCFPTVYSIINCTSPSCDTSQVGSFTPLNFWNMPYANNKDADQTVHLRYLISVLIVPFLDSILKDFKKRLTHNTAFSWKCYEKLSVDYLCRGHTWLESDLSLIPKCHGNSGDVTLVQPISKDFTNQWFMVSV